MNGLSPTLLRATKGEVLLHSGLAAIADVGRISLMLCVAFGGILAILGRSDEISSWGMIFWALGSYFAVAASALADVILLSYVVRQSDLRGQEEAPCFIDLEEIGRDPPPPPLPSLSDPQGDSPA